MSDSSRRDRRTVSLEHLRGSLDPRLDPRALDRDLERRRLARVGALERARSMAERNALLQQGEDLERERLYVIAALRGLDAIHGEMADGLFIPDDPHIHGSAQVAMRFSLTELVERHGVPSDPEPAE